MKSRSRSKSHDRSRSKSYDKSCSRRSSSLSSLSERVYHMEVVDEAAASKHGTPDTHMEGAWAVPLYIEERDGKRPTKPDAMSEDPTRARWLAEVAREPPRFKKGRANGFGSWYQRKPGNYSKKEFLAESGNRDRVRTADCRATDRVERECADDDSHKPSDWFDRTSIGPIAYKTQKEAEQECKSRREARQQLKKRKF